MVEPAKPGAHRLLMLLKIKILQSILEIIVELKLQEIPNLGVIPLIHQDKKKSAIQSTLQLANINVLSDHISRQPKRIGINAKDLTKFNAARILLTVSLTNPRLYRQFRNYAQTMTTSR